MKGSQVVRRAALIMLLTGLLSMAGSAMAAENPVPRQDMPANEFKLVQTFMARYGVTPEAAEEMVRSYLAQKVGKKPEDRPNPLAVRAGVGREDGNFPASLRHGKKLGRAVAIPGSAPVPYEGEVAMDRILILLVEFTDPVHNQMQQPASDDNTTYWVPDFNTEHYQNMLFDRTPGAPSMANYYLQQSMGTYTVDGVAYGWAKLSVPESEYGADGSGDTDNANGPVWRVVRDAVKAYGSGIPWKDYDQEDPYDLDGDGDFAEPDGYVDHLMIIHSGAGQEGGGGVQGDDAIWSHSWFANYIYGVGPAFGGVQTADPSVWVGAYTIMPEDGTIGVFCHEFAHDLGLPDEYDTIYSGESSPGFWSLMASGSWLGKPLGTQPSNISIWGRIALGWVTPTVVSYGSDPQEVMLDAAEIRGANAPAVRINLPGKLVTVSTNTPYSGVKEWFSGSGDDLSNTLIREFDLTGAPSAVLNFMTWYDIESDYDYGFVEASADGGQSWISLQGNLTVSTEAGFAITGSSPGWVPASYDLSAFAGGKILLRFRYFTDGGVALKGWTIDDISIPAIGFFDDVEGGNSGWTADGWSVYAGQETALYSHYYLLEWRNATGFDQSLNYAYNFYGDPDTAEFYPYATPGVLLWYRDTEYKDNWVGVHPGHGFLLVVDSHPVPDKTPVLGLNLRTRAQTRDAVFSLSRTPEVTLTAYGVTKTYPSMVPEVEFNDSTPYWRPTDPDNSVIVPVLGIRFRVLGQAGDGSAGLIGIYFKK